MRKIYTLVFLAVLFISTNGFSQNMFLKIATIEGESNQRGHEKEIRVNSYSQGITSCVPTNNGNGGANACKATVTPIDLIINFDKSNIALKKAVLMGTILASADFVQEKTGGGGASPSAYYKIHMENVRVVSTQESNSEGSGQTPTVAIELTFTKIAWQYIEQGDDGRSGVKTSGGWDLISHAPWTYTFPN